MARNADQILQQEVIANVSHLVGLLAEGCAAVTHGREQIRDICDLAEQAQELAAPVDDWESAAIEAGWTVRELLSGTRWERSATDEEQEDRAAGLVLLSGVWLMTADDAWEACEHDALEPHYRDVYEHWLVTDWLADKLDAKGEKVDRDFAGLTVWARTTTGQAISMDAVIQSIAADLAREYPG